MSNFKLSKISEYACLVIGDEILGGYVVEENTNFLIKSLSKKGYVLKEIRIVSDKVEDIATALTVLKTQYTFVVSMGGIGPTHDDRTFEGYGHSFCVDLVFHQEMFDHFIKMKSDRTEDQIKAITRMSTMPSDVELICLDNKWPLLKLENCYILPGLPSVCRLTIDKLFRILPEHEMQYYREWYTSAKEHNYFERLSELEKKYIKDVALGSYPIDIQSSLLEEGILSKISMIAKTKATADLCGQEIDYFLEEEGWLIKKTDFKN